MSYALSAFGVSVPACGPHAAYNQTYADCYCEPGYRWVDEQNKQKGCVAIDVTKPCSTATKLRSPVDKLCTCPPGTSMDPDPRGSQCIPIQWFPSCKDASGKSVPDCFMGSSGSSIKEMLPFAIGGAAVGVVATLLVGSFFK